MLHVRAPSGGRFLTGGWQHDGEYSVGAVLEALLYGGGAESMFAVSCVGLTVGGVAPAEKELATLDRTGEDIRQPNGSDLPACALHLVSPIGQPRRSIREPSVPFSVTNYKFRKTASPVCFRHPNETLAPSGHQRQRPVETSLPLLARL